MIDHKFYKEIPVFKMEIFVKFCQLQTLSKTGRALGLSPADVNNVIISLEKAVDGPVYVRKVDQFTLTEKGEELLAFCTIMLDAMENLDLKKINKKQKELTIAAPAWDSEHFIIDILVDFAKRHENVNVNLLVGLEKTTFNDHYCDVAIGAALPNNPEIQQRLLCEVVIKLFASKNYLEKYGFPTSIHELKGHKIINHFAMPPLPDSIFVNNRHSVKTDSFAAITEFLLRDQGIALLPRKVFDVKKECKKNCVEILPNFEIQRYGVFFLNRRDPNKTDMIETLFELISNSSGYAP